MSDERPHDINDLLKDLHEQIDWYMDRIESLQAENERLLGILNAEWRFKEPCQHGLDTDKIPP